MRKNISKTLKIWLLAGGIACWTVFTVQAQNAPALALQDCIDEVLRNNPELAAAREQINKFKADSKAAYTDFFPQLSGNLGYNAANSSIVSDGVVDSPSGNGTQQQLSVGPQLNQNIFAGFKNWGAYQKSKADVKATQSSYDAVKSKVSYDLKTAYTRLLFNQRLLKLNQGIVERRFQNFKLVELRFLGGRENKGSFLRSEAQHKQAEFDVDKTNQDRKVAQAELAKVLGRNEIGEVSAKGDFTYASPQKSPDFDAIASANPSTQEAQALTSSAKSSVTVAKSDIFPSINGVASYSRIRNDWDTDINRWAAGVNVSYPFLNSGRTYFEVRGAQAQLRRSEQELKSTNQNVIFELKRTYADLVNSIEAIGVQRKLLEAAETRAEIARSQYANGLMTYQDWDIIENELINTQKTMLASQLAAVVAEAAWEQAQGKGILP